MAHFLSLQSVDALLAIVRQCQPLPAEEVPLPEAFGRVLAASVLAPEDLPGFDRSTMDGFAVRAKDVFGASEGQPALMLCVGECPMGAKPDIRIGPGETARIWTGGMLPPGADAVVMLEYSREAGEGQVELTRPVAPGENMIGKDEDARQGQELLPAGRVLRPQELGILAALGQQTVRVRQKPVVAIISSGDEVLPLEATPGPGQVRDVNSYTLAALVTSAGGIPRSLGLVGDSQEALEAAVHKALACAQVVLVSGGSSAGQRDYTVSILSRVPDATLLAHGVAISPGKPLILAQINNPASPSHGVTLWGLPGHTASAQVCAEVFIRPLLAALEGRQERDLFRHGKYKAELARPVSSAQGRRDYIRVALEPPRTPGSYPLARPILGKSGLISTLVQAEALIICPEDQEGLNTGTLVDIYPLS